jgi:hypothetical protein
MENTPVAAANPLLKYFRQPAIYIKLPSEGRFWHDNAVDLPVTGEIPVYPMTTKDEITLRTPDALMNGTSVVEVIHSCCPNIKDAWGMPSIDTDTVLISIRIASYGHEMAIDTNCPHCNEENNNSVDLRVILGNIVAADYSNKVKVHNLQIKLRPQAFIGVNRQNQISFEEQKIMEAFRDDGVDKEAKAAQITRSMNRLVEIGIENVSDSTEYIEMEDGTIVSNKEHIKEFYKNSNAGILKELQAELLKLNEVSQIKPKKVVCASCTKDYDVPLEFDYANFFASGS